MKNRLKVLRAERDWSQADLAMHLEQRFVGGEFEVEGDVGLGHQKISEGPKAPSGRARCSADHA